MNIYKLKYGYVPLTPGMAGPGDRRRFVSYAKARNLDFEVANPDKIYDIVYLTYNCDIARWIAYKQRHGNRVKLVYELVDSYLFERTTWKTRLRGIGKFLTGASSKLYLDFKTGIKAICAIADAVVCSTPEQREALLRYNDNVHISLDVFEDDIRTVKSHFQPGEGKLRLVWEGQPYTLYNLLSIKDVLNDLRNRIELHLVTDRYYYLFSKKYIKKPTLDIIKGLECPVIFHEWEKERFSFDITAQDLAIIPIDLNDPLASGKPENKVVLLWKMRMPVLTSATKAYQRIMRNSGIGMTAETPPEWKEKIAWFASLDGDARKALAEKAYRYAITHYSREKIYADWDRLFQSVFESRG